jgi:hypothetical protein
MESYSRWELVRGIDLPCADILVEIGVARTAIRLRSSVMSDGPPRDLLLDFGPRILACMSHEEFVHSWNGTRSTEAVPTLGGRWERYAFPLLQVHNSEWLASFSDSQVLDPERAAKPTVGIQKPIGQSTSENILRYYQSIR